MIKLIIICILVTSCTSQSTVGGNKIRIEGHLILAAGGSCLISNDFTKSFQIGSDDFPESTWSFLKAQNELKDPNSLTNLSVFARVDVMAIIRAPQEKNNRIKVTNIINISECDPIFHTKYLSLIKQGKL